MDRLRWGIIATGFIAERFAEGLASSRSGRLQAVASRSLESAQAFARNHGASRAYRTTAELLESREVEAVYIATPHPFHPPIAKQAIESGKHVLCEKPLAMSGEEARELYAAARAQGVVLMEGYMYRCHPQTQRLCQLLQEGAIGQLALARASFGFRAPFDPQARLFSKALGGGAILDVGGYPLSFACLVARMATADSTATPELQSFHVEGSLHPETGVDILALATLRFANGMLAQISVGTRANQGNAAEVIGDAGRLTLPQPWIIAREGGDWSFELRRDDAPGAQRISGADPRGLYGIEADHFAELTRGRAPAAPGMSPDESIQINGLLEQWRKGLGVRYPTDA